MKIFHLPVIAGIALVTLSSSTVNQPNNHRSLSNDNQPGLNLQQEENSSGKMSSAVFKNQDYCRAELKNFEFDVTFSVVGATVYFSGANFSGTEKGAIRSNNLQPIKDLMKRCGPGSIVIFDDVKVVGPDKKIRTIPGAVYNLF